MEKDQKKKICKVAKSRFRRGDVSGDGRLDYSELAALLRRGDPTLRESEVRRLFEEIDSNDDGRIDFGEFCDYIFDQAELHRKPVPEYVKMAFHHFNGFNEKMSSSEFYRFCKESCLHNSSFRQSDAAIIFSKVKTKSQREINMLQFAHSLRLIAEKRGCDVEEVHQALAIYEDHEVNAEPSWSKHMDAFESAHKKTVKKAPSRTLETSVEGKRTGKLLDVFLSRSPDEETGLLPPPRCRPKQMPVETEAPEVFLELSGSSAKELPAPQRRLGPVILGKDPWIIGRRHQKDFLQRAVKEDSLEFISRDHFAIAYQESSFLLLALSQNRIWLNRGKVLGIRSLQQDEMMPLRPGDRILLGTAPDDATRERKTARLDFLFRTTIE